MYKLIPFLTVLLMLAATPVLAGGAPCTDANNHPRWCWHTDNDRLVFDVEHVKVTLPGRSTTDTGSHAKFSVMCDPGDYALSASGGFTPDGIVEFPIRKDVTAITPLFDTGPNNSNPVGYSFTVINHGWNPVDFTGYVTCAH